MKNRNIPSIIMVLLLIPVFSFGQDAAPAVDPNFWEKTIGNLALAGGAIVFLGALIALAHLFYTMYKMEELKMLREKGVEEIVEHYRRPSESWWNKMMKSMTRAVPVAKEEEIIFQHEYDGIRELDNKLPPWWLWLFYVTIFFSVVYWIALHVLGSTPTIQEEYKNDVEVATAAVTAYLEKQGENVDENTATLLTDEQDLQMGKSVFDANCVACHGAAGEGNSIGPNLTDEYWLHGGGVKNVFTTIKYGFIEKGMQPWKDQLRASDIQRVTSFILSLQGSNPPNAKAPQGDKWEPKEAETTITSESRDTTLAEKQQ